MAPTSCTSRCHVRLTHTYTAGGNDTPADTVNIVSPWLHPPIHKLEIYLPFVRKQLTVFPNNKGTKETAWPLFSIRFCNEWSATRLVMTQNDTGHIQRHDTEHRMILNTETWHWTQNDTEHRDTQHCAYTAPVISFKWWRIIGVHFTHSLNYWIVLWADNHNLFFHMNTMGGKWKSRDFFRFQVLLGFTWFFIETKIFALPIKTQQDTGPRLYTGPAAHRTRCTYCTHHRTQAHGCTQDQLHTLQTPQDTGPRLHTWPVAHTAHTTGHRPTAAHRISFTHCRHHWT